MFKTTNATKKTTCQLCSGVMPIKEGKNGYKVATCQTCKFVIFVKGVELTNV